MFATGVIGIIVVLAGTALSWKLVGDINRATGESLDVTVDALESMEDTVDLADDLIGSTSESLGSVEGTLGTVSDSFTTGSATISDIGELTDTAEPALRDAAVTLRELEGLGGTIDGVLVGLSEIPFGPDYDPDVGLGQTFGRLAEDIEPLPDEFAETSESLGEFEVTLTELEEHVSALEADVAQLNEDLATSQELVAQYRDNVTTAKDVAERSRRDLTQDQTLLRVILLVAGVNFAVAQIVPLWVGWELQDGDAEGVIDLYDGGPAPGDDPSAPITPSS